MCAHNNNKLVSINTSNQASNRKFTNFFQKSHICRNYIGCKYHTSTIYNASEENGSEKLLDVFVTKAQKLGQYNRKK